MWYSHGGSKRKIPPVDRQYAWDLPQRGFGSARKCIPFICSLLTADAQCEVGSETRLGAAANALGARTPLLYLGYPMQHFALAFTD